MPAALRDLGGNLRAGARLALFARVDREDFRIDAAQLLLMVIVSALVDNAADWVRHSPHVALDWAALGAELASFAVLVAIAALLAWAFSDPPLLIGLPILVLASLPLVQVANLAPAMLSSAEAVPAWITDTVHLLVLAWFLAVLWRSAFVAMEVGPRRLARSLGGAMLLALPLFVPASILPDTSWWSEGVVPSAAHASTPASFMAKATH